MVSGSVHKFSIKSECINRSIPLINACEVYTSYFEICPAYLTIFLTFCRRGCEKKTKNNKKVRISSTTVLFKNFTYFFSLTSTPDI